MKTNRRCGYAIAPYSGSGIDPPTCGAIATVCVGQNYHVCEAHYRDVVRERNAEDDRLLCKSVKACELADTWVMVQDRCKLFGGISRIFDAIGQELPGKLDDVETATRNSPLRKVRL